MASPKHVLSIIITFFLITTSLASSSSNGGGHGFTVELFHRDSPKSPLSTPKTTPFQHIYDAIHRSMPRANHFFPQDHSLNGVIESEVVSILGEYVMSYSVGTPPFEIFGILDTGSDLIWSQCKPCRQCYNQTAPLFNPKKSRTFRNVPCSSQLCAAVGDTTCGAFRVCKYHARYGDKSFSDGDLAVDTLTLGSTGGGHVAFPKTVFGCGYRNNGTFNEMTSGIVGLGGGPVSFITQVGSAIDGKFSYCLVPFFSEKNSSKLSFGKNAVVSGRGTVSTPIVGDRQNSIFYFLTLEAISVGKKRLKFTSGGGAVSDEGNIIIDSGTTLTLLPPDFYSKLESEVASHMKLKRASPQNILNLCYKLPSDNSFESPTITVHFRGADLKLNQYNAFVQVSEDVVCFAFRAFPSGSIFGNVAQMNFKVGYDLKKNTISFKPMDCTK